MMIRVVKASEIARLIAEPHKGDNTALIFGKIFEECYTFATYLFDESFINKRLNTKFVRKIAAEIKAKGIYSKELVKKAYKMYSALLRAGVIGEKPKTQFKEYGNILIAAQPDLWDWSNGKDTYYEFKTYPIDDYARAECKVFSYVIGKPIILIGLKEDEKGYIDFEKEIIDAKDFKLPQIPPTLGELEEDPRETEEVWDEDREWWNEDEEW
jgi:hypothetical protein